MVSIPAGPFTMGSNEGPDDERPAHQVNLGAYAIDRLPVTNAQYAQFLNAASANVSAAPRLYDFDDPDARIHRRGDRWSADDGFGDHPVVEVPWHGAVAYCASRGKRLPTEAEWEKAARGTDARRYPWGNDLPDKRRARFESSFNETAPADAFPAGASPYGARHERQRVGVGVEREPPLPLPRRRWARRPEARPGPRHARRRPRFSCAGDHDNAARAHAVAQSRIGASQHQLSLRSRPLAGASLPRR
jgi:hypothetical protein